MTTREIASMKYFFIILPFDPTDGGLQRPLVFQNPLSVEALRAESEVNYRYPMHDTRKTCRPDGHRKKVFLLTKSVYEEFSVEYVKVFSTRTAAESFREMDSHSNSNSADDVQFMIWECKIKDWKTRKF